MSLQRRLTIFTVSLTTIITLLLGLTFVENTYRFQINSIDDEINRVVLATKNGKDSLLTEALTLASASRNNLSLLVLDQNGELLPVLEQVENLSDSLTDILKVDRRLVKNITTKGNYRIRDIDIAGGDQLLVVADLTDIKGEKNRNYLLLFLFLLISSLFSLYLLRRLIARDVNRAITEIQTLDRLRAEEEKNHFLKNFIADASHELRTPLTVIKGYLELWNQKSNSFPNPERLELMLTEANRMDRNITTLLDFLEQETINEDSLIAINLSSILNRELEIFEERESHREIDKSIERELYFLGTEELFLTLLRNIFSNITRHSQLDSKVIVRAFARRSEVILQFENHWIKQASDSLDFEKLTTRFSSTRDFEKGGSGLGFSIMHGVATKLRGRLRVYRSDSGNFGVEILLPLVRDHKYS